MHGREDSCPSGTLQLGFQGSPLLSAHTISSLLSRGLAAEALLLAIDDRWVDHENYKLMPFAVKYLGLLAMGRILGPHPKAVQPHKDLVLACLDDKDESIRVRALDLLYGMVHSP